MVLFWSNGRFCLHCCITHYNPRQSHARIPSGQGPSGRGGQDKLGDARRQVDEVVDIMRDNMEKVLERDAKIGDLQDKSEDLLTGADKFQRE
jgi:hypothetical protein